MAEFERRLARGLSDADLGRSVQAIAELDAADRLWRGTPYEEFAFDEAFADEVRRLEGRRLAGRRCFVEESLLLGRHREILPELEAMATSDLWDEPLQELLLLALSRSGRHQEALRHYDVLCQAIKERGAGGGPTPPTWPGASA